MGVLLSFFSAVCSSSKDLVSKRLAFRIDGTTSTFASFYYALPYYVILLAVLYFLGKETFALSLAFLVLVLLRSVTDVFAEGLKMHAFAYGDISIVSTFFSLSPIFLLITSPLITGDRPSLTGILAVVQVTGGSLLMVYRPSAAGWAAQKKAIILAMGASVFFSFNTCFDRLAVQKGTPVFSGFTMTLLSALLLLPFIIGRSDRVRTLRDHRVDLLIRGFLEIAFMVAKLSALQYLQGPYVVGILRISLVLSIIGGRVFFKEPDFARRLLGGGIIVVGTFWIAWMEWN